MNLPRGYTKCPGVPSEELTCHVGLPEGKPSGYAKPKRNEHSPTRNAALGKPRVCQVCYVPKHGYSDTVCATCLADWNALQKLEKEIAKVFPASARLTTPKIFRRVWEHTLKLKSQVSSLKAKIAKLSA